MLFNSSKITGCKSLYRCNQNLSVLAGAGRLELCSSLLEGGLTPSLGEHLQIPLAKNKRKEKKSCRIRRQQIVQVLVNWNLPSCITAIFWKILKYYLTDKAWVKKTFYPFSITLLWPPWKKRSNKVLGKKNRMHIEFDCSYTQLYFKSRSMMFRGHLWVYIPFNKSKHQQTMT